MSAAIAHEPSLSARLTEAAPRLAARVLAEMYADPFWQARFGERGRGHARKDGDYHVTYVVEALAAGDPGVFVAYARWLREVLCARGMCSRHLAENYARLARAIDDEPWPDRDRATAILHAGVSGLAHAGGDAGAIDSERDALARAAITTMQLPPDRAATGDLGRARTDELADHLSFLADALAADRPDGFMAHVDFMAGLYTQQGVSPAHLAASLRALATAVGALPGLSARPRAWLDDAAAAVAALAGAEAAS